MQIKNLLVVLTLTCLMSCARPIADFAIQGEDRTAPSKIEFVKLNSLMNLKRQKNMNGISEMGQDQMKYLLLIGIVLLEIIPLYYGQKKDLSIEIRNSRL